MEKPDHLAVNCVAHDAMFRALLKAMPQEQFEAYSDYLSQLWSDIQIPKQADKIHANLEAAKQMCESMVETAKLERSR